MSIIVNPPPAGGGGGAATLADGADVTQGAKADLAWDEAAANPTIMAVLKRAVLRLKDVVTGVGAITDATWTAGDGTVIGVLKRAAVSATTVSGAVSSNRVNSNIQRSGSTTSVTIPSGTAKSAAIDISGWITGVFIVPSAMSGSSLTYEVSQTVGGTHYPLYDQYGNPVTTPISTSQARGYPFPAESAGAASLILVSSTNETAIRTIQINRKG